MGMEETQGYGQLSTMQLIVRHSQVVYYDCKNDNWIYVHYFIVGGKKNLQRAETLMPQDLPSSPLVRVWLLLPGGPEWYLHVYHLNECTQVFEINIHLIRILCLILNFLASLMCNSSSLRISLRSYLLMYNKIFNDWLVLLKAKIFLFQHLAHLLYKLTFSHSFGSSGIWKWRTALTLAYFHYWHI